MSMAGYTKLFSSILASTVWREDDKTRIVWITMLAMADKNGVAEGSVPGLADFARVSVDDCRAALAKLAAPDPDSRTPEFDGRRIMSVDGGWKLLNHAKYRAKLNADERREYLRNKQAEHRERVNTRQQMSTPSTQTEAEAEAEALKTKTLSVEEEIYQAYPLKVGKPKALQAIRNALKGIEAPTLLALVQKFASLRPPGTPYTAHPATWFNQQRFNDDPTTWQTNSQSNAHLGNNSRNALTY